MKHQQIRAKALLVLFALSIPLCAAEVFVRFTSVYGYWTPAIERARSFPYEAALFARHVFARKGMTARDGDIEYPINSKGYRGPEFEVRKGEDTVRIIVYGGSVVLDLASTGYRDWPNRIPQAMAELGVFGVEAINAGISGHSSFDSLGRYFAEGHLFEPDYVVLCNAWNDIKFFRYAEPLLRQFKPFRPDPRLVTHGFLDSVLCNVSQLYVRVRNRYLTRRFRVGVEGVIPEGDGEATIVKEALHQYRLNLELFCDVARNTGAVPVLMTQGRLITRDAPESIRLRIPYWYA